MPNGRLVRKVRKGAMGAARKALGTGAGRLGAGLRRIKYNTTVSLAKAGRAARALAPRRVATPRVHRTRRHR